MSLPVSFAPVVYEHAAAFTDSTVYQVSRSAELLARAHGAAYEYYRHRPVTVGIDVYNLEAEAYGARVVDTGGMDVPSIAEPIIGSAAEIAGLPDWDIVRGSRFGLAFEAAGALRERYPEADVRIPLSGPFSIAAALLGFDNLLCEVFTDPETVRAALLRLADKQAAVAAAAAERGFGVSFFESAAAPPLLSPDLFREVELPALRRWCDLARAALGTAPGLIVGGDTYPVLEDLLSLAPGFLICPGETDQRAFMEALRDRPELGVRINMRVSVLVNGSDEEVRQEADRLAVLGRETAAEGRPVLIGSGVLPVEADRRRVRRLEEYLVHNRPFEGR